jgi:hypothetical protein
MAIDENDYIKYRGKCKEYCEELISKDQSLTLVRGYYYDISWGEQQHWWCKKTDGTIVDPTKDQFPSKGNGEYVEFDGNVTCAECGKEIPEEEADIDGRYAFCSYTCHSRFVGIF